MVNLEALKCPLVNVIDQQLKEFQHTDYKFRSTFIFEGITFNQGWQYGMVRLKFC